jgi:caffeoyl-CoA O-methyltransferase
MDALVNILAEQYAAAFSEQEDMLLKEVALHTIQHHPQAHMLSGQVQGALLAMLANLLQPQRILEIGTFTGYSALCMAKGLPPGGELHTIELRKEDAATAAFFFNKSSRNKQIKLHVGNALEIIPSLNETWDIVFIDADKTGYIDYYELILPSVKTNGLIVADNVLFHGQVLQQHVSGKNAIAINAFNQHVQKDERVQAVMLTVRDGLLLIRKK